MEKGDVAVDYIETEKQKADGLTKPLARLKMEVCREALGLQHPFG